MRVTANHLSVSRVFSSTAFFVVGVAASGPPTIGVLVGLAAWTELSDILDGRVARWSGQVSRRGSVLDSCSDQYCRTTEFVTLLILSWVNPVLVLIVIGRDSVVVYTRIIRLLEDGVAPRARLSGKMKGVAQGATILLLTVSGEDSHPVLTVAQALCAVVTIGSLIDYAVAFIRPLRPPSPSAPGDGSFLDVDRSLDD